MSDRGAKKGERRGGRQKGTPNKKTAALLEKVEAVGLTPLEFLINTMNGINTDKDGAPMLDEHGMPVDIDFGTRLDAAKAAAPYCHAKRTHVEADVSGAISVFLTGDDADL